MRGAYFSLLKKGRAYFWLLKKGRAHFWLLKKWGVGVAPSEKHKHERYLILWRVRFSHIEFCEKSVFLILNFVRSPFSSYWILWRVRFSIVEFCEMSEIWLNFPPKQTPSTYSKNQLHEKEVYFPLKKHILFTKGNISLLL